MDSSASPPPPNPTTPNRRFLPTKSKYTPNKLSNTGTTSSQPAGSTQRALKESLTGNVVFANEAIVDAVFQPSKVDDQTVRDILAEINIQKSLKTALNAVVSNKLAETKKYPFMVRRGMSAYRLRR